MFSHSHVALRYQAIEIVWETVEFTGNTVNSAVDDLGLAWQVCTT